MTQTLRRMPQNDVDARIERFLIAEEEKYNAERKAELRALLEPMGIIGLGAIVAGTYIFGFGPAIKDSLNASPAKDAASIIEQWSVSHPTQQPPVTNEYISYPSYLQKLGIDGQENSSDNFESLKSIVDNPAELMVKVVNSAGEGTNAGFTVCAYLENDGEMLYSFDSATGERVENKVKTCS